MPASNRRYVAVGVYWPHTPDKAQILATNGKVVVFDTANAAREVLPRLGGGRIEHWSEDKETVWFTPLSVRAYNKLVILTGYDPYDAPQGIRSEAESLDWKHHVHWAQVVHALSAWSDELAQDAFPSISEGVAA